MVNGEWLMARCGLFNSKLKTIFPISYPCLPIANCQLLTIINLSPLYPEGYTFAPSAPLYPEGHKCLSTLNGINAFAP